MQNRVFGGFHDLRDFLELVRSIGELKTVDGADWDLELGGIAEVAAYRHGTPALLFDSIKGYPKGYRLLANIFGTQKRAAIVLRLPLELDSISLVKTLKERLRTRKSEKPVVKSSGPILENVDTGSKVDVLKFPTPRWHDGDGGRYIGTADLVITKDPEEEWVNVGTYRVMIHNKDTLGIYISPGHHGRLMLQKYWERGQNAPIAISVGHDPTFLIGSGLGAPWGVSEYDLIGWASSQPVELVEAPYTKLPVPATSEVVIEGECPPPEKESMPEGPFGEWTGYYATGSRNEAVVKVKTVLYRNDPILTAAPDFRPFAPANGLAYLHRIIKAAFLWNKLEENGVEEVTGVWYMLPGHTYYYPVISLRQMYPGHAKRAAYSVLATDVGGYHGRYVIVVDDDIDASNMDEVLWAVATRCDVETGIDIVRGSWSTPLDPTIPPRKRDDKDFTSGRAIINACRPFHWRDKFPKVNKISDQYKSEILERWGHLFK